MGKTFDSIEFVNHLAKQLIEKFDFVSKATTPVLVGNAIRYAGNDTLVNQPNFLDK